MHNLSYDEVFNEEVANKEGEMTKNGTYCVSTGQFTGRSPKDKYFVKQVTRTCRAGSVGANTDEGRVDDLGPLGQRDFGVDVGSVHGPCLHMRAGRYGRLISFE